MISFTHRLFRSLVFNFQILEDFHLLLMSNLIPYGQRIYFVWLQSSKYIKSCFMAKPIVYLGKCLKCTSKECILCCCCVECSINVNLVKLVDSVGQVFCILIDFSIPSINYRGVLKYTAIDMNFSISLHFCQFLLSVFEPLLLGT